MNRSTGSDQLHFATLAIHAGQQPDAGTRSRAVPIYHSPSRLSPEIRVNCVAPGWVDTELNTPGFSTQTYALIGRRRPA